MEQFVQLSHYLPIFTTIISAYFSTMILRRYRQKPESKQLLWWGVGVAVYGAGTLTESLITLLGWNVLLFKCWYISGALLGGAPLALGTVYLLSGRKAGNIASTTVVATVVVASIFVILSPINADLVDSTIPNGKVLAWQSIRLVSPFINTFAAIFLIGGAIASAIKYFRRTGTKRLAIGNLLIAIGAILPGIGGLYSRLGRTEVLYVGELIGILLIWRGYRSCQRPTTVKRQPADPVAVA